MPTSYRDVLDGAHDNHLLPFLWMKGEDRATITEYLENISGADIHEVCLESRTHPDFCGEGWWRDLRFVIGECRRLNMGIWILDDAHFPTGYANGSVAEHPELAKLVLTHRTYDVAGPAQGLSVPLNDAMDPSWRFMGVAGLQEGTAVPVPYRIVPGKKRAAAPGETDGEPAPSSGSEGEKKGSVTQQGMAAMMAALARMSRTAPSEVDRIVFDVPAGTTKLFVIGTSRRTDYNPDYINMVDRESCNLLIDAIYEPHFEHVGDEFGKTILGFFSDEPGFANEKGGKDAQGDSDSMIGKETMPLPWSAELERRLRERLGCADDASFMGELAHLWGRDDAGARARHAYMDVATGLYRECFDENIGSWCRDHGVMHIGHVIEDKGSHERLGSGAGHYFRAIAGQDMAGVDIVINQLVPGVDDGAHSYGRGVWDMAFFNYMLPKMGSSAAHLDPKKRGLCMAEVFGAFGWHEGLREMKWIADHFMVRGVNYFVPHAFSMDAFPDGDCPPHFYAHGNNPQFRHFGRLMTYMNRVSTLLTGGTAHPVAAVLYDADAAWAGRAMGAQRVCRALTRAQVDFDLVPEEAFADSARYGLSLCPDGRGFAVNGQRYRCLVIPAREFAGTSTLSFVQRLTAAGVAVFAVDELPSRLYDGADADAAGFGAIAPKAWDGVAVAPLDQLADAVREPGLDDVRCTRDAPWLRVYHYTGAAGEGGEAEEYYFCVNEHPHEALRTELRVRTTDGALTPLTGARVDVLNGEEEAFAGALELAPYESCLIVAGAEAATTGAPSAPAHDDAIELAGPWAVAHATAKDYPAFGEERELAELVDLTLEAFAGTAGTYRYRVAFTLKEPRASAVVDLGEVFETAEAWLDGAPLGVRLAPPYRFAAGDLAAGAHELTVEVVNTVDHAMCDYFSQSEPTEPTGILGPVTLR